MPYSSLNEHQHSLNKNASNSLNPEAKKLNTDKMETASNKLEMTPT
jgi:hypothetical protein